MQPVDLNSWYGQVPEFPLGDGKWGGLIAWAYKRWRSDIDLPSVLTKYYGREDELLSALAAKYDPELAAHREQLRTAPQEEAGVPQKLLLPPAPPPPNASGSESAQSSADAYLRRPLPAPPPPSTTDNKESTPLLCPPPPSLASPIGITRSTATTKTLTSRSSDPQEQEPSRHERRGKRKQRYHYEQDRTKCKPRR